MAPPASALLSCKRLSFTCSVALPSAHTGKSSRDRVVGLKMSAVHSAAATSHPPGTGAVTFVIASHVKVTLCIYLVTMKGGARQSDKTGSME